MQMAQTPLHVSAGQNRADIVKFILDWQGPDRVELEAKNMVSNSCQLYLCIIWTSVIRF